jgi:hypothetical protein
MATQRPGKDSTEPSADLRTMAQLAFQMFVALAKEGFTEDQALRLVSAVMVKGVFQGGEGDDG